MRYPTVVTMADHASAVYDDSNGSPAVKWTTAAITPAAAGIGMPTKYFFPGRPGFEGCGLLVILNRARRLAPATRNRKLAVEPRWVSLVTISGEKSAEICWNPHPHASSAGAM